ncbi:gluconate 2-dehydrogenase subunit 3 family protein [bacterium]|nr:gluconate 2-dehydrogenase subunit 3 family protein [bacterium]
MRGRPDPTQIRAMEKREGWTRRAVLRAGACGAAILVMPGCDPFAEENRSAGPSDVPRSGGDDDTGGDAPDGRWLSVQEHEAVRAIADIIIPPDEDPGGAAAGCADYIDFFLGAFTVDPPRIFAAGPFSGRHGGAPRFGEYVPLSRVKEIAWRNHIEGSQGIREREFNGPVAGIQEKYHDGLAELDARSRAEHGAPFVDLSPDDRERAFRASPSEFRDMVFGHVVEGMYAAPEYGGNANRAGWDSIGYEGDVLPRGYSRAEVEAPGEEDLLTDKEIDAAIALLRALYPGAES